MRNLLNSIVLSAISFTVLLLLCQPVTNADDDFYFMNTLAGGFGDEPYALLQYSKGWSPLLTTPLVWLFQSWPQFNWYTFSLLFLHLLAATMMLLALFSTFAKQRAVLIFLLYFTFFQARLILSLHYSHTGIALAVVGCVSLLSFFIPPDQRHKKNELLWSGIVLLLIAGLLRFHTTLLVMSLMCVVALVSLHWRKCRNFVLICTGVGAILLIAFTWQDQYYQTKISGWKQSESFRKAYFSISNHPTSSPVIQPGDATSVKSSFIRHSFIYNDSYITTADLEGYLKAHATVRSGTSLASFYYWTFMENRLYLLFMAAIALYLCASRRKQTLLSFSIMVLFALSAAVCFIIFSKITEGIMVSLWSAAFFTAVFGTCKAAPLIQYGHSKWVLLISACTLTAGFSWELVRLCRIDEANRSKTVQTNCWIKTMRSHPHILFVSTDNNLLTKGYRYSNVPAQTSVLNLIDKGYFLNRCYRKTLQRFGVEDLLQELPYRTDIILVGHSLPALEEYYLSQGLRTKLVPVPGLNCLEAYRLQLPDKQ
jgi:hypothetical protein